MGAGTEGVRGGSVGVPGLQIFAAAGGSGKGVRGGNIGIKGLQVFGAAGGGGKGPGTIVAVGIGGAAGSAGGGNSGIVGLQIFTVAGGGCDGTGVRLGGSGNTSFAEEVGGGHGRGGACGVQIMPLSFGPGRRQSAGTQVSGFDVSLHSWVTLLDIQTLPLGQVGPSSASEPSSQKGAPPEQYTPPTPGSGPHSWSTASRGGLAPA